MCNRVSLTFMLAYRGSGLRRVTQTIAKLYQGGKLHVLAALATLLSVDLFIDVCTVIYLNRPLSLRLLPAMTPGINISHREHCLPRRTFTIHTVIDTTPPHRINLT